MYFVYLHPYKKLLYYDLESIENNKPANLIGTGSICCDEIFVKTILCHLTRISLSCISIVAQMFRLYSMYVQILIYLSIQIKIKRVLKLLQFVKILPERLLFSAGKQQGSLMMITNQKLTRMYSSFLKSLPVFVICDFNICIIPFYFLV